MLILPEREQKNRFYLSFFLALPIYFHLKDIPEEEEEEEEGEGITLKEISDSIRNLTTDQAVYDLIFMCRNYFCIFLASMLKVACGTNSNLFLLISFPVTLHIP